MTSLARFPGPNYRRQSPRGLAALLGSAALFAASGAYAQGADGGLIARGKYLATAGDCVACHSATGGKPYAGGLYLESPFGQISTPNITPDKDTGIGNWTDDQFYRAMHEGIDDQGKNLYPAFPYQWFTKVTRDDVLAIKAYLFSLQPVHAERKPMRLAFPFSIRAGIAGWNALYFKAGTFQADPSKSPEWNRGAYLVEGLGHCSDCHTPKNAAQAPMQNWAYSGGKLDNWAEPNITSDVKEGIGAWSETDIATYLKTGQARGKTVAIGPMSQTIHDSLQYLTDGDLHAIAVYLKTIPPKERYTPEAANLAANNQDGRALYLNYCVSCHEPNGQGLAYAVPALAANGAVTAKDPQNVIRAVLGGLPAQGSFSPMPGFATVLSAQQIADVTNFVRTSWGNGAPATATADMVTDLLPKTRSMMAGTLQGGCTQLGNTVADAAIRNAAAKVEPKLRGINQVNLLPQVDSILADIHQAAPQANQADIVNALTASYCPVVMADAAIPAAQKAPRLDRFSELVYTELSTHRQAQNQGTSSTPPPN